MSSKLKALQVPSVDISAITALLDLDTDAFESVIILLCGEFQPKIDLLETQISSIPGVGPSNAQDWIRMFSRWASARQTMNTSSAHFIEQYSMGLGMLGHDEWNGERSNKWDAVKGEIEKVISGNSAITVYAKGMDLLFDHHECMRTTRIITDVRPIYDDEASVINGSVVFHTLIIECTDDGSTHHIAMDSGDLERLKLQIERAIRKEALITNKLYLSEIPVIDTRPEGGDR